GGTASGTGWSSPRPIPAVALAGVDGTHSGNRGDSEGPLVALVVLEVDRDRQAGQVLGRVDGQVVRTSDRGGRRVDREGVLAVTQDDQQGLLDRVRVGVNAVEDVGAGDQLHVPTEVERQGLLIPLEQGRGERLGSRGEVVRRDGDWSEPRVVASPPS